MNILKIFNKKNNAADAVFSKLIIGKWICQKQTWTKDDESWYRCYDILDEAYMSFSQDSIGELYCIDGLMEKTGKSSFLWNIKDKILFLDYKSNYIQRVEISYCSQEKLVLLWNATDEDGVYKIECTLVKMSC